MEIVEVVEIINECQNIKTIKFNLDKISKPGQFVMVWLPEIDEIPMSLSYTSNRKGITVEKVGEATEVMHALQIGDKIGIRGPFGNGFDLSDNNFIVVGGGSGTAALAPAVEECHSLKKNVTCAIGAVSSSDILFEDRMKNLGLTVKLASDDGSVGHHGFVTDVAEDLLKQNNFDQILACGPEPMLVKMVEIAKVFRVPIQCSLERYMKCGIGICGSCQLGKYTVCKDGPVFIGDTLMEIDDFGKWKRGASGKKLRI